MRFYMCIYLILLFLSLSLTPASAAVHSITPWSGNRPAALSITFDDGYISQYSFAMPALNKRGFVGTFFIMSDLAYAPPAANLASWDNWITAAGMGHEIGSHTKTHPDLVKLSLGDAEDEITAAKDAIDANIPGQKTFSFAYPFGSFNSAVKAITQKHYIAARGVSAVLNNPSTDMYNENAYDVSKYSVSEMETFTAQAVSQGRWLIPTFHSFNPTEYGGWTADQFLTYMDYLKNRSDLWIAPFGNVIKYMKERAVAKLSVSALADDQITLFLTDTLDDRIYDQPLTLRSEVPVNWPAVNIQQGSTLKIVTPVVEGIAWVAYYDAVPDKGLIALTPAYNQQPVAVNDNYSMDGDTSLIVAVPGVLANDSGSQGANLTALLVTGPAHGTLDLNANGSFVYTPVVSYLGIDSFTYTANNSIAGSDQATVTITVVPKPVLNTLLLNPATVVAGLSSQGTVTLTGPAQSGGVMVFLSGNSLSTTVPASVIVPYGSTSATFTITTTQVTSLQLVTISAVYGSISKKGTLIVVPALPVAELSSLSLTPGSVIGGTDTLCTLTISAPAPAGGAVVILSNGVENASVAIAAGDSSITFPINTGAVAITTIYTITATYKGVTKSATLTVTPNTYTVSLSNFILSPTSVVGGAATQGEVTLSGPAPSGGAVVTLSDGSATANVMVLAGSTGVTFTIDTRPVTNTVNYTITATYKGVTKSAVLVVTR